MTVIDGYTITQHTTRNVIIITLPQRWDTLSNTITPISNRRMMLTDAEESDLLMVVKAIFENGEKIDEVE